MTETQPHPSPATETPVWPYVVPLAGFLALTALEAQVPASAGGAASPVWYPVVYAFKIASVAVLLWVCRRTLNDLRPWPGWPAVAQAVALGLLVTAVWIGLDGHYPAIPFMGGSRTAFDPATIAGPGRFAFLALRLLGLVVIVPVIEELFYRSFLMRWVVDPDVARVPIGRVTPLGMAATSVVFALSHPEWLPALLAGLAWGWLVGRTGSLTACVLSHATANLALGAYVLWTKHWHFW